MGNKFITSPVKSTRISSRRNNRETNPVLSANKTHTKMNWTRSRRTHRQPLVSRKLRALFRNVFLYFFQAQRDWNTAVGTNVIEPSAVPPKLDACEIPKAIRRRDVTRVVTGTTLSREFSSSVFDPGAGPEPGPDKLFSGSTVPGAGPGGDNGYEARELDYVGSKRVSPRRAECQLRERESRRTRPAAEKKSIIHFSPLFPVSRALDHVVIACARHKMRSARSCFSWSFRPRIRLDSPVCVSRTNARKGTPWNV